MPNFFTSSPIVQDLVLPFVLIFTLIFAILEKSKLLGDEKKQVNAIIAFVIAGLFLAFSQYVSWIKQFSIVMVVILFVVFVFLLIWGFVWGDKAGDPLAKAEGLKWLLGVGALIIILVAVLKITGFLGKLALSGDLASNIIFIVVIIAAVVAVLNQGKKSEK